MLTFLKNKNIQNSLITLFIRGLGVLLLFGISMFMTNTIDEKWVGQYEYARVILLCLSTLALIGTDQAILYFSGKLASENNLIELKDIYKKMLIVVSSFSIILVLISFIIPDEFLSIWNVKPEIISVIKRCLLIIPFYAFTLLNTETIRAYNYIITAEVFRNILKFIPLLLGVAFIYWDFTTQNRLLNWYLYGFIGLAIISFGVLYIIINHIYKSSDTSSNDITSKEVLKKSYPMAISGFYTFLLMTIDVTLIEHFFDQKQLAFYATAVKVMSILSLVIVSININYATKITSWFTTKNTEKLQKECTKASKIIALINLIVGVFLLSFGYQILSLFGENYTEALDAYYILISTQIIVSCFGLSPMYMNMTNKQHIFHKIMLAAVCVNIISNLILIPKHGLVGAAISYSFTVIFWNILVIWFAKKKDNIILYLWK